MVIALDLRDESYDGSNAQALIADLQQEYVARYGSPDTTPVEVGEFAPPNGRFVVAYDGAVPVAMGGIRMFGADTVEVKRMYVVPSVRRRGLGRALLHHLEQLARDLGAKRVVLETGRRQPEAMQLYQACGYTLIDGFGHYRDEPESVSYGKDLTAP